MDFKEIKGIKHYIYDSEKSFALITLRYPFAITGVRVMRGNGFIQMTTTFAKYLGNCR